MVIGMKYGRTRLDDLAAKEKTYETANAFMTGFLRRNHSLNCTDLIGHNLSDPNARALAREKNSFTPNAQSSCGMPGRSWKRFSDFV